MLNLFSKLFGGDKKSPGEGAERARNLLNKLQSDLNLTDEQTGKIKKEMMEFFQDKKAMKQSGNKDGLRDSRQEFMGDIRSILNAEQLQKFMANIDQYKSLMKGG